MTTTNKSQLTESSLVKQNLKVSDKKSDDIEMLLEKLTFEIIMTGFQDFMKWFEKMFTALVEFTQPTIEKISTKLEKFAEKAEEILDKLPKKAVEVYKKLPLEVRDKIEENIPIELKNEINNLTTVLQGIKDAKSRVATAVSETINNVKIDKKNIIETILKGSVSFISQIYKDLKLIPKAVDTTILSKDQERVR